MIIRVITSGAVWPYESWETVTRPRHALSVSIAVVRALCHRLCEYNSSYYCKSISLIFDNNTVYEIQKRQLSYQLHECRMSKHLLSAALLSGMAYIYSYLCMCH